MSSLKRLIVGAGAALAVLAVSAPASAETVHIRAKGTIEYGSDTTGVFGVAGADLAGQAFSFAADFDLTNAGYLAYGGFRTDIYGGEAYSHLPVQPPSLGGGVLTVNGHDFFVQGQWNSLLLAYHDANFNFDYQFVQDYFDDGTHYLNNAVLLVESPSFGFFTLPNYVPPSGNLCATAACNTGNFSINERWNGTVTAQAFGQLNATSITITTDVTTGVPEPATWALAIIGFGMTGATLRARRFRRVAVRA